MAFCLSRLALFFIVYIGLAVVPLASGEGFWRLFENNFFIDGFSRFDSGWYLSIAEKGYSNSPNLLGEIDTAFFPGYPLLLAIFKFLGTQGMGIWGIISSNLLFGFGLCLLYDVSKFFANDKVARLAVALAAFSPFSIFFSSIYTESLFFFCTTFSFWFSTKGKMYPAMLAASFASLTKVVGIFCVPFSLVNLCFSSPFGSQGPGSKHSFAASVLPAVLTGFSLIAIYSLYLKLNFGNAFQFAWSQKAWLKHAGVGNLLSTWSQVSHASHVLEGSLNIMGLVNSAALAISLGLIIQCIKKQWLPLSLSLWSLLTVLASSSLWFSGGRFVSAVFPIYIMLALCLRRFPAELSVGVSALFMSLFALFFSHWFWVA